MKSQYRHTNTSVSLIRYHLVFCPKYRRKIFLIPGVEQRFKELTHAYCGKLGFDILAMECHVDHVHMFISTPPDVSPSDAARLIKGATSHELREEFPQLAGMTALWTRSFFVSTAGDVSAATIKRYVESQKTRP